MSSVVKFCQLRSKLKGDDIKASQQVLDSLSLKPTSSEECLVGSPSKHGRAALTAGLGRKPMKQLELPDRQCRAVNCML